MSPWGISRPPVWPQKRFWPGCESKPHVTHSPLLQQEGRGRRAQQGGDLDSVVTGRRPPPALNHPEPRVRLTAAAPRPAHAAALAVRQALS